MPEKLLYIPWFAGILYSSIPLFWFAIHPFAPRWQKMQRSPYRLLLPLWAVIIAGLSFATWPWRAMRLYSAWWTWLLALPFFWLGLKTYRNIPSAFGLERFTGQAELRPQETEQTLVITGLHSSMRHPIYFAHLCMFAGWTIGGGLLVSYLLLALSLFCTFPLMIWLEERELVKRFGPSYLEYQNAVPLVPGWMSYQYKNRAPAETSSPLRKP
jgi:hypothetical protein